VGWGGAAYCFFPLSLTELMIPLRSLVPEYPLIAHLRATSFHRARLNFIAGVRCFRLCWLHPPQTPPVSAGTFAAVWPRIRLPPSYPLLRENPFFFSPHRAPPGHRWDPLCIALPRLLLEVDPRTDRSLAFSCTPLLTRSLVLSFGKFSPDSNTAPRSPLMSLGHFFPVFTRASATVLLSSSRPSKKTSCVPFPPVLRSDPAFQSQSIDCFHFSFIPKRRTCKIDAGLKITPNILFLVVIFLALSTISFP